MAPETEQDIPLPEVPPDEPAVQAASSGDTEQVETGEWDEIRRILKTSCPLIAGVLNESRAFTRGPFLLIDAPNENFRSMVNNPMYRDAIRKAALNVLGKAYKLGPYTAPKAQTDEKDPLAELAGKLKNFEIN